MRRKKLFFIAPLAIAGIALFIFIGTELVMHLWNWLLPPLFGWRTHHLLAGIRTLGAVPNPLRQPRLAWRLASLYTGAHARAHGRALAAHDTRAARENEVPLGGLRLRAAGRNHTDELVVVASGRWRTAWTRDSGCPTRADFARVVGPTLLGSGAFQLSRISCHYHLIITDNWQPATDNWGYPLPSRDI